MQKITYIKLGILTFLILLGFVGYQFFSSRLKSKEQVLGKKTQLKETQPSLSENAKSSLEKILKQAVETAQKTTNEAAQTAVGAVGTTTTRTVETVKEYIYDKTVGNALQQINNLPAAEKEKIKEYICK